MAVQGDILRAEVVTKKIIPNVSEDLAKALKLKPHHKSIGIITASIDDVTFIALDECTKTADVDVVYAECNYSGFEGHLADLAGEAIGIIAGPNPAEVKSGLEACAYECENGAYYIYANDDENSIYLAHNISSSGTFLSIGAGVEPGVPLAYCIAPPTESIYAMDAALKAADVKLIEMYYPPYSTSKYGGGLFTGSQSACQAACDAFAQASIYVARNPLTV